MSARAWWRLALALAAFGCGSSASAGKPVGISAEPVNAAPEYQYDSLDARPVSSAAFRGKPVVLSFITTWDLSSQAEVAFLVKMAEHDGQSVNYAVVALQEPDARELVEQYTRVMKVTFPVAMADVATMGGGGAFGDVRNVPTTIVLDASGRVVFRAPGVVRSDELRAHLPPPAAVATSAASPASP